jgi:hypothetical protein
MSYSDDGQYYWNGTDWIPADQAPDAAAAAPSPEPAAADPIASAEPGADMGMAAPVAAAPVGQASADPRYDNNELEVKQRIRSLFKFGQQYDIYTPGVDEAAGYAHRGLNFPFMKCDLVVYTDQTQQTELLRAKQSNGFDAWGSFDIMDSQTGEHIATYKRHYWAGIFRRKWTVSLPDGTPHFQIQEDSLLKSLVRRFGGGLIPFINIILRTNMNFRTIDGQTDFGSFNRKFSLRDRYQLQRATPELDGRLLWVTGPLLDNAGGR